jgi:multidrug efflux pump subunit AcrA (membrane-fusion protein)
MHGLDSVATPDRPAKLGRPVFWLGFGLLAALVAPGCHHEEESRYKSVASPSTVQLIEAKPRNIVRIVGQPSFVEAYERSSVYPKMNAYIREWKVDIGDPVKKNQPLAYLFVPELVQEHGTKQATVKLDEERVELAKKVVLVAKADVEAAMARLEEAQAELISFQREVDRWESEVKRLKVEVDRGVLSPQDLLQAENRGKASLASRDAAKATVEKAKAELLSRQAALSQANVDVHVAEAALEVAKSEEKRLQAWVDYLTLPAPFDGVVVARNANTFDFVLPTTGDPTADPNAPFLSPSGAAAPIYVVDRTDVVRIFVEVPEQHADYVKVGTKARVQVKAFRDEPIPATVTRTSWALNDKTRTLRAEIDLYNSDVPRPYKDLGSHQIETLDKSKTGIQLLPGMYAYGKVIIERPGVRALPVAAPIHLDDNTFCEIQGCKRDHARISALMSVGEKTFCWLYEDGRARRVEVQTGLSDLKWIEVTNRLLPPSAKGKEGWVPFDGTEQVILLSDLTLLVDGGPVTLVSAKNEPKVASEAADQRPANSGPTGTRKAAGSSSQVETRKNVVAGGRPPDATR